MADSKNSSSLDHQDHNTNDLAPNMVADLKQQDKLPNSNVANPTQEPQEQAPAQAQAPAPAQDNQAPSNHPYSQMTEEEMEREFAKRFERENPEAAKIQAPASAPATAKATSPSQAPTKAQDSTQDATSTSVSSSSATSARSESDSKIEVTASTLNQDSTVTKDSASAGADTCASADAIAGASAGAGAGAETLEANKSDSGKDGSKSDMDGQSSSAKTNKSEAKEDRGSNVVDELARKGKSRWRLFKRRNRRHELMRSLQFRIVMLFFIVGLITTASMCALTYVKIYNTTREFVDEELSQISLVAINYKMILPRRWEAPRNNYGRIFRVQSINGRLVLTYGFENDNASSEGALAGPRPEQHMGPGHGMRNGIGPRAGAGARSGTGASAAQNQDNSKEVSANGQPLTPSIVDIHKFKYDIIIAPLFGRPGDALYIPPGVADGFYTVMVADQRVRAFVSTNTNGQRFVVARPLNSIDSITHQAFISAVWQFVGIILLFIPLLMISVRWMFANLNKIAKSLYKRSEDDLSPVIPENHVGFVPSELDGFILALNKLFSKVDEGIHSKRRFIAYAAHEMRTPLTALSLQAESLEKEELSSSARLKVERLKDGISRERQLMTSLLTLAREQNRNDIMLENIDIFDLYTKLIDEQGVLADRKDIDLGVEGNVRFNIVSDRMRLLRIMSNLLSNAIKYTPDGGRIDLMAKMLDDGRLQLIVQDDGPGIPEECLKHILEPFYRVGGDRSEIQGTGLGLAIVKASCESINANLEFSNASPHGLIACVTMASLDKQNTATTTNRLLS